MYYVSASNIYLCVTRLPRGECGQSRTCLVVYYRIGLYKIVVISGEMLFYVVPGAKHDYSRF